MVAGDHLRKPPGFNDGGGIARRTESPRHAVHGPIKPAPKTPGGFLQGTGRQVKLEPSPESQLKNEALVTGEVQAGGDDAGVKDNPRLREVPTSARYSSTRRPTSSGPMLFSLAFCSPHGSNCLHSHSSM